MNIHHRNFLILAIIGITIMAITVGIIVMGSKTETIKSVKGYDFVVYPPKIEKCIGLEIKLIGSFEEFKKIHDAYECEFKTDVVVTINDTTQYYTFDEFYERLGFGNNFKLRSEYEDGFRYALESLALLALELDLKNERKTYGEMFDILYERNQIKE